MYVNLWNFFTKSWIMKSPRLDSKSKKKKRAQKKLNDYSFLYHFFLHLFFIQFRAERFKTVYYMRHAVYLHHIVSINTRKIWLWIRLVRVKRAFFASYFSLAIFAAHSVVWYLIFGTNFGVLISSLISSSLYHIHSWAWLICACPAHHTKYKGDTCRSQ